MYIYFLKDVQPITLHKNLWLLEFYKVMLHNIRVHTQESWSQKPLDSNSNCAMISYRRKPEYITEKYSSLTYRLFWAEGN